MNTSKEFYYKEGKLELSMLDEEDEEVATGASEAQENEQADNGRSENYITLSQTDLYVNKDIYDTLHTMGQFLTGQEEADTQRVKSDENQYDVCISKNDQITAIEKEITLSNACDDLSREPEQNKEEVPIAKVNEDTDTCPMQSAEPNVTAEQVEENTSQQVQSTKVVETDLMDEAQQDISGDESNENISIEIQNENSCLKENHVEESKEYGFEMDDSSLPTVVDSSRILTQQNIDYMLEARFKNKKTSHYLYVDELKRHIDKHIEAIINYQ